MTLGRNAPPRLRRRRDWGAAPARQADGRVILQPRRHARLHLGCGDRYLPGYLNVDFPPDAGTASGLSRPDVEADLRVLDCVPGTLREIRLHHVFEHFERAEALALLIRWREWLEPGGTLVVETPDFEACVYGFATRSPAVQALILRHVFGSQEAPWARHLDGWSSGRFAHVFAALGFDAVDVERTTSDPAGVLVNVVVRATRTAAEPSRQHQVQAARSLLDLAMNGDNETERRLRDRWYAALDHALESGTGDGAKR